MVGIRYLSITLLAALALAAEVQPAAGAQDVFQSTPSSTSMVPKYTEVARHIKKRQFGIGNGTLPIPLLGQPGEQSQSHESPQSDPAQSPSPSTDSLPAAETHHSSAPGGLGISLPGIGGVTLGPSGVSVGLGGSNSQSAPAPNSQSQSESQQTTEEQTTLKQSTKRQSTSDGGLLGGLGGGLSSVLSGAAGGLSSVAGGLTSAVGSVLPPSDPSSSKSHHSHPGTAPSQPASQSAPEPQSSSAPAGILPLPLPPLLSSAVGDLTSVVGGVTSVVGGVTSAVGSVVGGGHPSTHTAPPAGGSAPSATAGQPNGPTTAAPGNPLGPIVSGLGPIVSGVGSIVSGVGSGVGSVASGVGSAVGPVASGVGSAVGPVGSAVGITPPSNPTGAQPSHSAGNPLGPIVSSVAGILPSLGGGILPSTGGILPTSGGILPSLGGILPSTGGILPTSGGILPSLGGILPSTGGILPTTGGILPSSILPLPTTQPTGSQPSKTGATTEPTQTGTQPTAPVSGSNATGSTETGSKASATGSTPTIAASLSSDSNKSATLPTNTAQQSSASVVSETSIHPTGTDSLTAAFTPSSIVLQPSTTNTGPTSAQSTGLPSNLPMIIPPPGSTGLPAPPAGSELVQFGFLGPLNYNFVISTRAAINEIFADLPQGVGWGLGIDASKVVMQSLQPFDTTQTYGYITTVAMCYVPQDMVSMLADEVTRSWSQMYHNPDSGVKTVMSQINPNFPLIPGSGLSASGTGNPSATTSSVVNMADPLNNNNQSSSVSGTTVGIGVGVAAGAALYGAAMFFVARRYRRRKGQHRRSPSLIDTTSMAQSNGEMVTGAGAALMGGSRDGPFADTHYYGGSGRTSRGSGHSGPSGRDISAPVNAENSLGWN